MSCAVNMCTDWLHSGDSKTLQYSSCRIYWNIDDIFSDWLWRGSLNHFNYSCSFSHVNLKGWICSFVMKWIDLKLSLFCIFLICICTFHPPPPHTHTRIHSMFANFDHLYLQHLLLSIELKWRKCWQYEYKWAFISQILFIVHNAHICEQRATIHRHPRAYECHLPEHCWLIKMKTTFVSIVTQCSSNKRTLPFS